MRFKNLLVAMSLGLILSAPAFSKAKGGYSGGGGDLHEMSTNSAWYLGQSPISYCIQRSERFVLSTSEIQRNFEAAVNLWKNYISDRRIHLRESPQHRLNLNYQYSGTCTGKEDLKLYFGVETPAVDAAKKKFENCFRDFGVFNVLRTSDS